MHSAKAKEKEAKVQYNVMVAEALVIFEEIAHKIKEAKEEKEGRWDGKEWERAKKEEEKAKAQCTARVRIVGDHTSPRNARKERVREKGLAKKGQIRSFEEQWPVADFGVGKLCCISDGKGVGGKEREYLPTYTVSVGENRPLGGVAGSPVSDCNKLVEDADEESYRDGGLLGGNSPDRMPISDGKGEEMPNLEDSESEEEERM